jgi:hypothetical protein
MPRSVLPIIAFAFAPFVLLSGCDVSQKRPETAAVRAMSAPARLVPREPMLAPGGMPAGAADATGEHGTAGAERSIRLYGPGVSRKRQTRV